MCKPLQSYNFVSHSNFCVLQKYPPEFNAWLLFRGISEVILANDLVGHFTKLHFESENLNKHIEFFGVNGCELSSFSEINRAKIKANCFDKCILTWIRRSLMDLCATDT